MNEINMNIYIFLSFYFSKNCGLQPCYAKITDIGRDFMCSKPARGWCYGPRNALKWSRNMCRMPQMSNGRNNI
jgi:hypothetical protein